MPTDQLFKELPHSFFREFLELFFPELAARLEFSRVQFLDKELFTDFPEGSRREPDLVAQVTTLDGEPELILVHVEVQAQHDRHFAYRMFEYYALLRLRYKLPVFPVVLYLRPGTGGLAEHIYTESLFGRDVLSFHYAVIGLPDLSAENYREQDNPLAPALSALMQPGALGRLHQKYLSVQQALLSSVDEARKSLLINLIETYLKLSAAEEEEFARLLGQEEAQEVRRMITVYEERGIAKGIEQGREQGIVQGKQDTLLKLLRHKFGALSEGITAQIQTLQTEAELDALLERVLDARSLAEMGLSAS